MSDDSTADPAEGVAVRLKQIAGQIWQINHRQFAALAAQRDDEAAEHQARAAALHDEARQLRAQLAAITGVLDIGDAQEALELVRRNPDASRTDRLVAELDLQRALLARRVDALAESEELIPMFHYFLELLKGAEPELVALQQDLLDKAIAIAQAAGQERQTCLREIERLERELARLDEERTSDG